MFGPLIRYAQNTGKSAGQYWKDADTASKQKESAEEALRNQIRAKQEQTRLTPEEIIFLNKPALDSAVMAVAIPQSSPFQGIKPSSGVSASQVLENANRVLRPQDADLMTDFISMQRNAPRGNYGLVGLEAQKLAEGVGLEATQGNQSLSNAFKRLLESMDQPQNVDDFYIPKLGPKR